MKKLILKLFSPFIWLFSLPKQIAILKTKVDQLTKELKDYEESTDKDFNNLLGSINHNIELTKTNKYKVSKVEKTLKAVNISADVCINSPSWVVMSYKSNKGDIVKFFNLERRNIKEIEHFLSHFEQTNKHIDAPPFMHSRFKY